MDTRTAAVALLLMASLVGPAAAYASEPDRLPQIVNQQRDLQKTLDSIEGLTTRQRNVIRKMQDQVFSLVDGKTSLDAMTIDEKVRLENALERINAELVNTRTARDGQNQCHMEKKTGSGLSVARCASREERDQTRQGARAWMERPKICSGPGCG